MNRRDPCVNWKTIGSAYHIQTLSYMTDGTIHIVDHDHTQGQLGQQARNHVTLVGVGYHKRMVQLHMHVLLTITQATGDKGTSAFSWNPENCQFDPILSGIVLSSTL